VTIALFQSGWHWLVAAVGAVVVLAVICVALIEHSDRDWLSEHKRQLRRVGWGAGLLFLLAVLASQLHKVEGMLKTVEHGDPWWLALAVAIESFSFVGYVVLTHEIFGPDAPRLNWAASVEITFGGVVATRLLSAGGAGGIAFTAWGLRAAGMSTRRAAESISAFLALLYAPFIAACLFGGLGGGAPAAVVWVGVGLGAVAVVAAALITLVPGDLERRARRMESGKGRRAKIAARAASVPVVAGKAARTALALAIRRPALLGWALLWWAADVAVLDACFRAFGHTPALGVLILGYFLGHIGNLLPMPGGVGGVEGGMVGVFVACGIPLSLAVVGTIAYQVISTWLPVAPGLGAYWSLRRRIAGWRQEDGESEDAPGPFGGASPVAAGG
jgi:uncharacterized membrane protein YbhN (UPF0104 family)